MRAIETILKETATTTEGVKHYGRGTRSYANIESKEYPRIWIHAVNPIDTIHINSSVTVTYEVIGEISTTIDYTEDIANNDVGSMHYLTTLYNLESIYFGYITTLNRHPLNKKAIGRVTRRELLHEYDDNLVGYVFTFEISVNETIAYQCP